MLKIKYLCIVTLLILYLYQNASAELAAVGPVNSNNGFPTWYMDENGVPLKLCLTSANCTFDTAISNNTFSQNIGFGEKAYYWSADADLTGTGAIGSIKMALVASFSGSTTGAIPANGEQITFVRIAIGPIINLTPGGIYTVIHPYGVSTNLVADASGVIPVQRQDIGCAAAPCDFNATLKAGVGPFLKWDSSSPEPPIGFIGNSTVPHKVIGSPFGTNIFAINGPNAGGSGVNTKETDLFKVQGELFMGAVPTPLVIDRATYTRPLPSAVNVTVTSAPSATLKVSATGITDKMMVGNGKGKFFAHIPLAGELPDFISVTANNPPNTTVTVKSDLVDDVKITLAEYNSSTFTLTIEASSSDKVSSPTLTALSFGNLTFGKLIVPGLLIPPAEVTVVSTAGGSDTTHVSVTANIKPVALNDSALVRKNFAAVINVLANDTAMSGTFDPATVAIMTAASYGTTSVDLVTGKVTYTPSLDFVGKDSFTYTVKDSFAQISNIATVNLNVTADELLTVTKAVFKRSWNSKSWLIQGKSTVKAPGNIITLYAGPDTTGPVIGTTTVNQYLGSWIFSKFFSSVDPGTATSITAQSTLGTVVTFPLTIK